MCESDLHAHTLTWVNSPRDAELRGQSPKRHLSSKLYRCSGHLCVRCVTVCWTPVSVDCHKTRRNIHTLTHLHLRHCSNQQTCKCDTSSTNCCFDCLIFLNAPEKLEGCERWIRRGCCMSEEICLNKNLISCPYGSVHIGWMRLDVSAAFGVVTGLLWSTKHIQRKSKQGQIWLWFDFNCDFK